MRKDIKIGINSGDIVLQDTLKAKAYPITMVSKNDTYVDFRVTVPAAYNFDNIWRDGIAFILPYTPIYKQVRLYVCKDYGEGEVQYLVNPTNNTLLFPLYCGLYGKDSKPAFASQLVSVNPDFIFKIMGDKSNGRMNLYSGAESDVVIENANKQNADLLLKCVPSSYYRYPSTGVGLVLYLNSNTSSTELSQVIKREFENDNVVIKNANLNPETGELIIDQDTTKADGNV